MYLQIEFTNKHSPITHETWNFILIESKLYLDGYKLKTGAELLKHYGRLDHRSLNKQNVIDKEDVPMTSEIKQQAISTLFDKIDVCVWDK